MKFLRSVKHLLRRGKLDAEMTAEMQAHVELQTERNLASGMNPDEARYAALRQFGNVAAVQEEARAGRGFVWLEQLAQDLRFALRQLARTPGFTAVVVAVLALGIGGTTGIFSVVNTVILNPVGGPEPERMVQIGEQRMIQDQLRFLGAMPPVMEALETRRDAFERLGWSASASLERKTADFIRVEPGAYVSWDFFAALDCAPMLGRGFRRDEAVLIERNLPARDTAVVLSYAWWKSEWGGDPGVLGRTIEMGGRMLTVVGIMPSHFVFPNSAARYWVPAERFVVPPNTAQWANILAFARLKPGASATATQAMLDTLAARLMADYPEATPYGGLWRIGGRKLAIKLRPLSVALQDGGSWAQLRQTLLGLFAAIGFVLLIVCANVANLVLARIERRRHELAVRAAVGAGRGRLMRQLMTENLLLALLGGAAGLVVAAWVLKALIALNVMPRLRPVELDGPLLAVTLGMSALVALCFGLAPMWRGGNVRVQALLADGGANSTGGRGRSRYRDALVVLQVAVAIVLLAGAGLMLRSVSRVLQVDPGFDPENLLFVEAQLPRNKFDASSRADGEKLKDVFIAQVHERIGALPGVLAVGVQQMTISQSLEVPARREWVNIENAMAGAGGRDPFKAMRVALAAGRPFVAEDAARPGVVLVNESLARRLWPNETAVGQTLGGGDAGSPKFEVVGVVNDARTFSYLAEEIPRVYHPFGAEWTKMRMVGGRGPQFIVRTQTDPEALIPLIRSALKAIEPDLRTPVFRIAKQVLFDSTLAQRTYRNYLALFAGLGLLLSALGIYGVLAFSVACRTREIGIRLAIGADAAGVRAMILQQGGRLILAGIVAGLAATCALTRFLQSQLFNVSPTDPLVLGAAVGLLGVVALAACWLPARRAAQVDPVVALRAE